MKKSMYIFLCIVTLGLFYFWVKSQAKKKSLTYNKDLIVTKDYDFKIEDFIKDLGGENNIKEVDSTMNSVIVKLNDLSLVNSNFKNIYKIKGINKSANSLILLIGDNAKTIAEDLKNLFN